MLIGLLTLVINILIGLVFARAILSWFPGVRFRNRGMYNAIVSLTDPILVPCQRLLPARNMSGLDLSPTLAVFLLLLLRGLIPKLLHLLIG